MYTVNPTEQNASFKAAVLVCEFHALNPCSDKKKILDLNSVPVRAGCKINTLKDQVKGNFIPAINIIM